MSPSPGHLTLKMPLLWLALCLVPLVGKLVMAAEYVMPLQGEASLTHYDLPLDFVAACGCSTTATFYPTAALSKLAYGSKNSFGPGCGRCFNITLSRPVTATPPFYPASPPSVVVKIVDQCPGKEYCSATTKKTNRAGETVHFDLALPSPALNLSFFPSDEATYGYTDFGVWLVRYDSVSCDTWAGWNNSTALGVESTLASLDSGCCPANPLIDNSTCPASISAATGISSPYFLSVISIISFACYVYVL